MKKIGLLVAVLAISPLISPAGFGAEEKNELHLYQEGFGHFYVEGLLGYGEIRTGRFGGDESVGGTSWGSSLGYLFNTNTNFQIGVELGYFYPKPSIYLTTDTKIKLKISEHEISGMGVIQYNLGKFGFFSKLGIAFIQSEVRFTDGSNNGYSIPGYEPKGIIGVNYSITKHISVSASASYTLGLSEWFNKQNNALFIPANFSILGGVKYSF